MKTRWTGGGLRLPVALVVGVMTALPALACAGTGGGTDAGSPGGAPTSKDVKTDEVTATMGQPVEVANLTATVSRVDRRKTVGSVSAGYLVAQVAVANKSSASQKYHRLQFRLQKPDGTSTNRTPIAGETQLGEGELAPGAQVEGQLIFTVEQAGGSFAVIFEPRQDDQPERKRGLWPFESQPADAT
jgi:hypothetical protein